MINLSELPAPDFLDTVEFETELARLKTELIALHPDSAEVLQYESEPLSKLLQLEAYLIVQDRLQKNNQVKNSMLAYAEKEYLDARAADYNVKRQLLVPEDLNAIPPVEAVYENDDSLRERALLAWESLSTAGPEQAYQAKARSAHPNIRNARCMGPELTINESGELVSINGIEPGCVKVAVLSRAESGIATAEELLAVQGALRADIDRPMTDYVTVQNGSVNEYAIDATLYLYDGPDSELILSVAKSTAESYAAAVFALGLDISRAGIIGALFRPGVQDVVLHQPAANIVNDKLSASRCTSVVVAFGGRRE